MTNCHSSFGSLGSIGSTEFLAKNLGQSVRALSYQDFCQKFYGDPWGDYDLSAWKGAVLFLLFEDYVLFIKRSEDVPSHKGQLALIGGHRHQGEDEPLAVGLREFEEETGISSQFIRPLGLLPPVLVASGELIIPVLGELMMDGLNFQKQIQSNGEWVVALAVSLKDLSREDSWCYGWRQGRQTEGPLLFRSLTPKDYWVLKSYPPFKGEFGESNFLLWGATARILWNLFQILFHQKRDP